VVVAERDKCLYSRWIVNDRDRRHVSGLRLGVLVIPDEA
jgi:hypothetical protein